MESNTKNISLSIGFITPEYPHEKVKHAAGIGTSVKNLALAFVKEGVEVFVFVYNQSVDEIVISEGVKIHLIKFKKYKYLSWFFYRKYLQKYINSVVKKESIKILEAPDWTGVTAFMSFSVPLVIRLHGSDAYFCKLENRKQKFKNFVIEKTALKSAKSILSVSSFTAKQTKQVFSLKKNIKVIHNGVDTQKFMPINKQIETGQILYFGSIIRKKGILELAKAYNKVVDKFENPSLVLMGSDTTDIIKKTSTLELFYQILTPKAKATVICLDKQPYDKVREVIAKAHVIVLPSFAEAFPMTWLEALAMEKALVTSDIGWANELMINGKTGYTINPKNHVQLSEKILELLRDQEKCKTFGKNGRQRVVDNFSTEKITNQNIKYYKEILKK